MLNNSVTSICCRCLELGDHIPIRSLLTDNGSQFTDRFTSKKKDPVSGDRIPSGKHVFDVLCKQLVIEHRLIPPRHPQTNGMVERFNGRISEVVNQTRFGSRVELESTLRNYLKIYNHNIPQRALDNATPIQAMKKWQEKKPELFVKRVYNQAGLDRCLDMGDHIPTRSLPFFRARLLLSTLLNPVTQLPAP